MVSGIGSAMAFCFLMGALVEIDTIFVLLGDTRRKLCRSLVVCAGRAHLELDAR